jgi:prepilin-type N-terminal cleavage/methylation domain-containing protein
MHRAALHQLPRGGFSLVEMLIVLAIAGILVTMGFAYLISARPHALLEQGEVRLQALMTKARNLAVSEEINTRVVHDVEHDTFTLERQDRASGVWSTVESAVTLPDGISVPEDGNTFPDTTVRFTPRGTLMAGGSISLKNADDEVSTLVGNLVNGRFTLPGGNLR